MVTFDRTSLLLFKHKYTFPFIQLKDKNNLYKLKKELLLQSVASKMNENSFIRLWIAFDRWTHLKAEKLHFCFTFERNFNLPYIKQGWPHPHPLAPSFTPKPSSPAENCLKIIFFFNFDLLKKIVCYKLIFFILFFIKLFLVNAFNVF